MEKSELVNAVYHYETLMRDRGLHLGELVKIKFSTRARNWLGKCAWEKCDGEKYCTLTFATALLALPDEEVINVVVHEILHMLVDSHGHDALWYEGARLVHKWWPEIIISKRAPRKVTEEFCKHLPKRKVYRVNCPKCTCHVKFYHRIDVVKGAERGELSCPGCGSKMVVIEGRE